MSTELTTTGLSLYRFGKILDEPIDFYHSTDCVSKTRLDTFIQSPLLYWKKHVAKILPKEESTEALIIGQAVDTLALEGPDEFAKRFSVVPNDAPKRPTAAQRAILAGGEVDSKGRPKKPSEAALRSVVFWDAYALENKGKTALTSDQEALVKRCGDALHSDEWFQMLMAGGQSQVTFRLEGRYAALQCRPDRWLPAGNELTKGLPCILDLKTIAELPADQLPNYAMLNPEESHVEDHLPRHIASFGYHRSAYWYREVVAAVEKMGDYRPPFILCFVEKEEPHAVNCRPVDAVSVGIGERQVRTAMNRMIECIRTKKWPAYWNRPTEEVGLPPYYVRQALNAYGADISL